MRTFFIASAASLMVVAVACGSNTDSAGSTTSTSAAAGGATATGSTGVTSTGQGGMSAGQGGSASTNTSTTSSTSSSSTGAGGTGSGPPPLGNGKTYYVAPTGNDQNSGSATSPWATIQHAGTVLQTGDTVIVRAGSYGGAVFCYDGPNQGQYGTIAGAAGNPITFEADPAATPGSVIINARNDKTPAGFDLEPGCDYVNIVGFTFDNTNDWSMKDAAIRVNGSGDAVADNTMSYVNCTSKPESHADAAAQSAGGKGFGMIADNVTGALLSGNDVSFTCGNGDQGHGLYLSGSSSNAVIRGNSFHDNGAIGIHINGDVSEGNAGLVTKAVIEDNTIFDNGENGINADGLQSSTIQNNVLFGNDKSGITLYQIDAGGPSKDDVIVNNTIVQTGSADAAIRLATDDAPTTNITVFNNILVGGKNGAFDNDAGSTCTSDYNISATALNSGDAANDAHSSVHAAAALGFMGLAGNDYRLTAGSPAIDAGVASLNGNDAPTTDLAGMSRPSGKGYDVGAYEE